METTDSHDCYDDGSQKTSNFDNREQTKNGLEMNEFRKVCTELESLVPTLLFDLISISVVR